MCVKTFFLQILGVGLLLSVYSAKLTARVAQKNTAHVHCTGSEMNNASEQGKNISKFHILVKKIFFAWVLRFVLCSNIYGICWMGCCILNKNNSTSLKITNATLAPHYQTTAYHHHILGFFYLKRLLLLLAYDTFISIFHHTTLALAWPAHRHNMYLHTMYVILTETWRQVRSNEYICVTLTTQGVWQLLQCKL